VKRAVPRKEESVAHVHEVTVWTRGVVKDKEGRDVANGIAAAADREGRFSQAFDNYVDLPDRVNVPLRKYARISDREIEMRYDYENEKPEVVVLVDATIVKGMNVLRGMKGDGILVVNTSRSPDEILKFLPEHGRAGSTSSGSAPGWRPPSSAPSPGPPGW
jgi:hypothetical protein